MESGDYVAADSRRSPRSHQNGILHGQTGADDCASSAKRTKHVDGDKPLYFDYNATTPMAPEVKAAVVDAMEVGWGNPSSDYAPGRAAKSIVDDARRKVATMINAASPDDVIFTSGGTEADNWVVHSALNYFRRNRAEYGDDVRPHVITTTSSVREGPMTIP